MPTRVLLLQGHPDHTTPHFCHALARAYCDGAAAAGHEVRTLDAAVLALPFVHSKREFEAPADNATLQAAQADLQWANHLVIVFPLWLGDMPAQLKGCLEQLCRPQAGGSAGMTHLGTLLKGKSARIIVTMGMPALLYRVFFLAHGVRNLARNVLGFVGAKPVRTTYIGLVENMAPARAARLLAEMKALGANAE